MSRDITVKNRCHEYCGNKYSDLIILFDIVQIEYWPEEGTLAYDMAFTRDECVKLHDIIDAYESKFKNPEKLNDQIYDLWVDMDLDDVVRVHVS